MPIFFHGWRRKLGVVTVLLACVFIAGWIRSHAVGDSFAVGGTPLRSYGGIIEKSLDTLLETTDLNGRTRSSAVRVVYWQVPYWLIVISLTLLGAWLLLSKPRKSLAKPV